MLKRVYFIHGAEILLLLNFCSKVVICWLLRTIKEQRSGRGRSLYVEYFFAYQRIQVGNTGSLSPSTNS